MSELNLHYTGNPFVDVGLAAIMAHVKKRVLSDLTLEDLTTVAEYLKPLYAELKPVQGQLSTLFPNSGFTQPAFKLEQKRTYADLVLLGFLPDAPKLDVPCTFFPDRPAYRYVHRQFVPLLSAEDRINFTGEGSKIGLPVSGEALLAIAAILLGAYRSRNWLIFHEVKSGSSDDMTLILARKALQRNYAAFSLVQADPDSKWPTLKKPRRVYIDTILEATAQVNSRKNVRLGNITGYHFTNYGTSASVELIRLGNDVWDFISAARNDTPKAWDKFIAVGQVDKEYNRSYEVLFDLPHDTHRFMSLLKQVADWNFTELFLRKVLKMNQKRIQLLKDLGDRFAKYMNDYERDGKGGIKLGFYHDFSRSATFNDFRKVLLSAGDTAFKKGNYTLFTPDEFVLAFNSPEDRRESWTLPRDLVTMRLLELLPGLRVSEEERAAEVKPLSADVDEEGETTEKL